MLWLCMIMVTLALGLASLFAIFRLGWAISTVILALIALFIIISGGSAIGFLLYCLIRTIFHNE